MFLTLFLMIYNLLCAPVNAAPAQIVSTGDLGAIEKELETLDSNSLVLFDVDLTLIVPNDAILRPASSDYLDELLGGEKVQNLPTGRRYVFREILTKAPHSLIDERSLSLVRKLQERGVPVAAFTNAPRGKVGNIESVADWRVEELQRFGFDFSSTWQNKEIVELPKDQDQEFAPIFKSGIIFSSLHPKGKTLSNFLAAIDWKPKKVVMIDDEVKYVQSVGESLKTLGVSYTGFHYTGAKQLPCNLDRETAQFQVRRFFESGEWITDTRSSLPSGPF